MSPHPSDHAVAALVRNARLGAAATPQHPARTRSFGSHSATISITMRTLPNVDTTTTADESLRTNPSLRSLIEAKVRDTSDQNLDIRSTSSSFDF